MIRDKLLFDSLLAIAYEPPPSTECNQPAHAWYQTPSNNQHITQGQNLLVIAAGVEPDTVAQFKLFTTVPRSPRTRPGGPTTTA